MKQIKPCSPQLAAQNVQQDACENCGKIDQNTNQEVRVVRKRIELLLEEISEDTATIENLKKRNEVLERRIEALEKENALLRGTSND